VLQKFSRDIQRLNVFLSINLLNVFLTQLLVYNILYANLKTTTIINTNILNLLTSKTNISRARMPLVYIYSVILWDGTVFLNPYKSVNLQKLKVKMIVGDKVMKNL